MYSVARSRSWMRGENVILWQLSYLQSDDVPVEASHLRHVDRVGNVVQYEGVDVVIPAHIEIVNKKKNKLRVSFHLRTSKIVFFPVFKLLLNTPCLIWKESLDLKKSPGQLCSSKSKSSFSGQVVTPSSARSVAANLVDKLRASTLVMLARLSMKPSLFQRNLLEATAALSS